MIVMKFGGTSVESAEAINRMITIVRGRLQRRPVVVVSAFSKVTDSLYKICDFAELADAKSANVLISDLRSRHLFTLQELIGKEAPEYAETEERVNELLNGVEELVRVVCTLGELSDRSRVRVISVGEMLSSTIICAALNHNGIKTAFVEAKKMIITNDIYMKAAPYIDEIKKKVPAVVKAAFEEKDAVITQGFVSSNKKGVTTVLGRGGSDYTASLIGMSLDAEEIEIWTDVDGIFTADPRRVPTSRSLRHISFDEATEMAHFGAKVLHPFTILPAIEKNIPVRVLNSRCPTNEGTLILQDNLIEGGAKSVSFKENITVINIFSTKMINSFGFLGRVFEIFSRHQVSVDLISTSEANVSLTLEKGQNIQNVVEELSSFADIRVEEDKAQISVIGKDLINIKGLCTQVFGSLQDYRIYMISQGASAINLSFVVDRSHLDDIVNKLHNKLFNDESSN